MQKASFPFPPFGRKSIGERHSHKSEKDFSVLSRLVSHLMIPRFALHTLHNAKYVYMITPVTPTVTPFTL